MSVAVLVNARARHGSEALVDRIRAMLPEARVAVSRSLDEVRDWVRNDLPKTRAEVLLSGGGDGTAVTLLNELRDHGVHVPAFGLLALGTGNGWVRATADVGRGGALERQLMALREFGPMQPGALRRFDLVETEGRITPFAGTGWDAEILADYHATLENRPAAMKKLGGARGGYLQSLLTRTLPRHLGASRPTVRVVNLGEPALTIDPEGNAVPFSPPEGGATGAVLYEGPIGVGGASTTEELGLGFRAFPFAHLVPGRMSVRVYAGSALDALVRIPKIWRGIHPVAYDHHFFVTRCRFEFDRAVPFEIGGDLVGERTQVEMSLVEDAVSLIDWRKLAREPRER